MKKKLVTVSVINDVVTDQRVYRTCSVLYELGYEVVVIGRSLKNSLPVKDYPFKVIRMRLLFEKGPLFYMCFNIRLFFMLIFKRQDLFFSNDLDTLLPNYIVSRIRRKPLIYDAHEYFTGVPELQRRPLVRAVWRFTERITLRQLRYMITVNESIAGLYSNRYGITPVIVRNIPEMPLKEEAFLSRGDLGLPTDRKILILQGSGINIQRGAEEAVEAMRYVEGVLLLIVGSGDVLPLLKDHVAKAGIHDRVCFIPKVPMRQLRAYTRLADGGITLDKDTNINYKYSLPNKLFDYIHAGIPVLASDLPEIRKIIDKYDIGIISESHRPEVLAEEFKRLLFDEDLRKKWKENLVRAAAELNWDREKIKLSDLIIKASS